LTAALTQSKTTLQAALNTITGQGDMTSEFDSGAEDPMAGAEDPMAGAEDPMAGAEDPMAGGDGFPPSGDPMSDEDPEAQSIGNVGRAKR